MKFVLVMLVVYVSMFIQNIMNETGKTVGKERSREAIIKVWVPIYILLAIILTAATTQIIFWVVND